jgi:hypothetical protein
MARLYSRDCRFKRGEKCEYRKIKGMEDKDDDDDDLPSPDEVTGVPEVVCGRSPAT